MKTYRIKSLAICAGALGLVLGAGPVAAEPTPAPSEDINLEGIDLSTKEGQRALEQRIEIAARKVCGLGTAQTGSRVRSVEVRRCLSRARREAERQLTQMIEQQGRNS